MSVHKYRAHNTRTSLLAEAPRGVQILNPKNLRVGKPFRVLTADEPVRSGDTGALLGQFSLEQLSQMVEVFYARANQGEGQPKIDNNHGPTLGGDPTIYGMVLGAFIFEDARGPGLYVIPGYTNAGAELVQKCMAPDGLDSTLTNSPEFIIGSVHLRSSDGRKIGDAELLGVALTGNPQQSERIIDPVLLTRHHTLAEGVLMDEEQVDAQSDRVDALEARFDGLEARFDKLLALFEEQGKDANEQAQEFAETAVESVDSAADEAVEQIEAALEEALEELSAEEEELLDADTSDEERHALTRLKRRHPKRLAAAKARTAKALSIVRGREVRTLRAQVQAMAQRALDAECDAAIAELRNMGMPMAREEYARRMWSLSHDPAMAAARSVIGDTDTPWDVLVKDVKRGMGGGVPLGRQGFSAKPSYVGIDVDVAVTELAKQHNLDIANPKERRLALDMFSKSNGGAGMALLRGQGKKNVV